MKRIALVGLFLIGLATLGLHSEGSNRPASDFIPATPEYRSVAEEGGVQSPPPRQLRETAFPARAPSFGVRPLPVDHVGEAGTVPLSLASGDFDGDGVPDLLCGYAGAGGSFVTLHRGNVDAIFPYGAAAQRRRIEGTFTDAPFLTPARTFEVRVRPDHLGVGDFDNDGTRDVVVGALDGESLLLLAGDGEGGLRDAGSVSLPGRLTAMIAGEVNRPDGLVDLVVALVGPEGPAALVFEGPHGALQEDPEVLFLPAPATSLALGPLASHAAIDLVIGAERQLLVVKGRDRKTYLGAERRVEVSPPEVVQMDSDRTIRALASGDFAVDSEGYEVAVLFDDGTMRLFDAGNTADGWTVAGERHVAAFPVAPRSLQAARVSGSVTKDLVVLDAAAARLVAVGGGTVLGATYLEGPPIAVLPMRLDPDALMDLVVLDGGGMPRVYRSAPDAVITVDTAADVAVAGDGSCSLREAIGNANGDADTTGGDCAAGVGADTILFNVGGGGFAITIDLVSPLPAITDSITIDGDSQVCDAEPCVELSGLLAGVGANGLTVAAGSSTLRGLNVHDFDNDGISLESAGNFVEGSFIGTDQKGTAAAGNTANGVLSLGADNTIGGTAPGAGNLVSANDTGIRITGPSGNANVVQGNLVGTDAGGTADLGNVRNGVVAKWSPGNVIGGTSAAARNVVSGNNITGIYLNQPETVGNLVQGNFAGTNLWGNGAIGNTNGGVVVLNGAADNTIGGPAVGARNLISGNTWGVVCYSDATGNLVLGNFIGVEVTGTFVVRNAYNGIQFEDADGNIAGGTFPEPANLVSGNGYHGVVALRADSSEILGNYIGTDLTGTVPRGNLQNGVHIHDASDNIVGGGLPGSSNLISANGDNGVLIRNLLSSSNEVSGNYIGTDVTGTLALGNIGDGVDIADAPSNIVGGTSPGARNVISSNNRGVIIHAYTGGPGSVLATLNQVLGNYIGTDVTGTVNLGNVFHGVVVKGPDNTIGGTTPEARNVISGNDGVGVWLRESQATGNEVLGNYIGVDISGSVALGNTGFAGVRLSDRASDNTIGGTTPGARNIISGNTRGVLFDFVNSPGTAQNHVTGNFIGTDVSGTVDLGNDLAGILIEDGTDHTIGGTAAGAGNVISGNGTNGVAIMAQPATSANRILGNLIGTDVTGTVLLGNDDDGVNIENSADNVVGGTSAGTGNLIAGNGECGVEVYESVPLSTYSNAILGNSIVSNIGMGIDHGGDGITTNDPGDPDPGPNLLQNFPVVTLADATPAGITIDGTFNSGATRQFRLEFFTSTECDASGCGEGERYLGFEGVMTDFGGNAVFSVTLAAPVSDGDSITATATDSSDNTSEFADCFVATCQSFATLGQTIGAADKDTLAWASASDVRFVKGDLALVGSYTFSGDGTMFGVTSLDISVDHPDAGDGLYYVVRPLGCGSWQNVLGSEVGRDSALP